MNRLFQAELTAGTQPIRVMVWAPNRPQAIVKVCEALKPARLVGCVPVVTGKLSRVSPGG